MPKSRNVLTSPLTYGCFPHDRRTTPRGRRENFPPPSCVVVVQELETNPLVAAAAAIVGTSAATAVVSTAAAATATVIAASAAVVSAAAAEQKNQDKYPAAISTKTVHRENLLNLISPYPMSEADSGYLVPLPFSFSSRFSRIRTGSQPLTRLSAQTRLQSHSTAFFLVQISPANPPRSAGGTVKILFPSWFSPPFQGTPPPTGKRAVPDCPN